MNVTINNHYDELFNILNAFHILINYDYYQKQVNQSLNLPFHDDLEKYYKMIKEEKLFDDAIHYVGVGLETESIFNNYMLQHEAKDIQEYLRLLKNQSSDFLLSEIYKRLDISFDDEISDIVEQINQKKVDDETKWFFMRLIQTPEACMKEYIEMINTFIPIYNIMYNDLKESFENFSKTMSERIEKEGIGFLNDHLPFLNLEQYDHIIINYSLTSMIASQTFGYNDTIYIYLGLLFKKFLENQANKDDTSIHTNIFKVLSDPTRFELLQLLSKQEMYGQELSEKLNVSTATISYHMDYLFSNKLVTMTRKDRKIYYSLNKERLKESMVYLTHQFKL